MLAPKLPVGPTTSPVNDIGESLSAFLSWPSQWPGLQPMIEWCQQMPGVLALILGLAGIVFLSCNVSAHRFIMSINCAALGAWCGGMLGSKGGAALPGLLIGCVIGALIAWPMFKHTIRIVAGGVGFIVGSCVWKSVPTLLPEYAWAGGTIGFAFLFMLTFSAITWATIIAIGFQGSAMLVMGIVGGLCAIPNAKVYVQTLFSYHYAAPLAIAIPAVLGLIYQQNAAANAPAPAKK